MHHADYIAHQHLSGSRANRITRSDAYCNAARRTLNELAARRTAHRRMVRALALVDVICIAVAVIRTIGVA